MNQQDLATCHCIISHPSKPKFLVIKHKDHWSPPIVMVPYEGPMNGRVALVTDSVRNHYGLETTVLRLFSSSPGYHCIELEMPSMRGSKNLQAVWVGSEEYSQFTSRSDVQYDPLAEWLKEKEAGKTSPSRPAWEKKGWFAKAESWIDQQLERHKLVKTGSVEQFRGFRTSSCILRVPTVKGWLYMKACFDQLPREAAFTKALSQQWPKHIPQPLSVNLEKNWMLSWDYANSATIGPRLKDYADIARVLANIQLESLGSMEQWKELNCPEVSLDQLSKFAGNISQLSAVLGEGGHNCLTSEEIDKLNEAVQPLRSVCHSLEAFALPDLLVHPDIWNPNILKTDDSYAFIDWSGTVISHPFFCLHHLLRFEGLRAEDQLEAQQSQGEESLLTGAVIEAYLEAFTGFEPKERLMQAMSMARQLDGLWRLFIWRRALDWETHLSVEYQVVARHLQRIARTMIEPVQDPENS